MLAPRKESYDQSKQHIKKQRHYFANKGPSSQGYGFSSGQVWMWELDYKESWAPKNWCFWTVVLEKTLESPLDCKEIQPDHPKGDQSWVFIGRTNVEAETPILWPSDYGELTHRKRPWCWERLKAREEGDDRGWDGWMASPTQWTRVWVDSGSWWWIGRPGVLRFLGSQSIRQDWETELNWTELNWAWPHPSEQGSVSPTVSLSHQEASIRLLCLYIREQTEWKLQSKKTNQTDHRDHSLV